MALRPIPRLLPILALLAVVSAFGAAFGDDLPSLLDQFNSADVGKGLLSEPGPQVSASLSRTGKDVTLSVRVELPEGGNTYSQDPSFAKPTTFEVSDAVGLTPADSAFVPSEPPKRSFDENFGKEVEKHYGTVTWTRKYRVLEGADPDGLAISGKINLLYCKESCRALTLPFRATLGAAVTSRMPTLQQETNSAEELPPPAVEEIGAPGALASPAANASPDDARVWGYEVVPQYPSRYSGGKPVTVRFVLDQHAGDGMAALAVTLDIAKGYHSYAIKAAPGQETDPTILVVSKVAGLTPLSDSFTAMQPPELHEEAIGADVLRTLNHSGTVTWTRIYKLEPGAQPGLAGSLTFSICNDQTCLPPKTISFSLGGLQQREDVAGAQGVKAVLPADVLGAAMSAATGAAEPGAATSLDKIAYQNDSQKNSLLTWMLFAFLGGLILNVMPCVLPVISIKVLSFVHQAGEHPLRVFLLNAVYSLGVLTVFFALATLALTLQLGWGAQNQSAAYNIVMVSVVFAMGLSLLGVFEIPIPGMMSSGIGGRQHGEGLMGAFLTGILATLLATPCTGPYMATTLFWSLQQPPHIVFLIFGVMGLGMASPYLLIGCFPQLVDWLPRPGQWMVTFKQVCGFVLMGTAVWMLNTIHGINTELVIPTLIILVGVGVMVWMVGQLYDLSSSAGRRWGIRGLSLLVAGPVIALGVNWAREATEIARGGYELPWQPFSTQKLEELVRTRQPVLIDFTADWCGICKANEFRALNTEPTLSFVNEHGFVPLKADYTRESPEIRVWLNKFGQDSVPLYLFIPGGQPDKTLVLRESINQSDVLQKLEEAARHTPPAIQAVTATATTAPRDKAEVTLR